MQIEFILKHPMSFAQLTHHIWPHAGPGETECLIGIEQIFDIDFI